MSLQLFEWVSNKQGILASRRPSPFSARLGM
eukprot:CAMPEP_0170507152 /NCGR_PEP_ID=MMETSP0208-20121228/57847_1 /TAXON_ID=197538 /ORGANISM="Strombidium inclinatum, Strain S3" /LENGTH=30 /DNA_ID= /DNA_START= /DNA_END= /DNA_ORIENTATION=